MNQGVKTSEFLVLCAGIGLCLLLGLMEKHHPMWAVAVMTSAYTLGRSWAKKVTA